MEQTPMYMNLRLNVTSSSNALGCMVITHLKRRQLDKKRFAHYNSYGRQLAQSTTPPINTESARLIMTHPNKVRLG